VVGDGAQLTYVTVQDWADDAVHHSTQHAKVGRDGSLKHVAVTFGGNLVRHDTTASYDGPGGEIEMLGLYFADEGQHVEHRLFVDHTAPKTKSHVVYKGALQGEGAHTVWIGNVLIRKEAEGIETYEENRNLVLTDGCQADSAPATPRRPAGSTTSSCSTCARAASPSPRPAGWSCTASSTT
jgi:Fe-S cluster assembly protein SufD